VICDFNLGDRCLGMWIVYGVCFSGVRTCYFLLGSNLNMYVYEPYINIVLWYLT
jgi:hypothetical protein